MKVLFIEPYPIEGPSSRYRVEQYVPYLSNEGVECKVRPFVSSDFYKIIYKRGFYFRKLLLFLECSLKRIFDIFTALKSDIIFIHLEAFPFGPPLLEWVLFKFNKKIIYDLDDAIYMGATSPTNWFLKCLKYPSKIKKIIRMSRCVITCNEHLADYVSNYNKKVTVIPTSVDTLKFCPAVKKETKDITIGWIGSHSTAVYLEELKNVFDMLSRKFKFNLKIIGAGRHNINIPGVNIIDLDWHLEDEIAQFRSLDIGVYPLPDNEWIKGKTGFKTVQYMSVGVPCVVSNVGRNKDIVRDGVNGYLANTDEEWVEKLSLLINNPQLRKRIAEEGLRTVEERFSLKVNAPKLSGILKKVYNE